MASSDPAQHDEPFVAVPLERMTRWVIAHPWQVLGVAVVLTLASLYLVQTRLGYKTSRMDLQNPDSEHNRLWIDYIQEFGDDNDVVIVVEGESAQQVIPVLDELNERLARHTDKFHSVLHEVNLNRVRSKGLFYMPLEDLQLLDQYLERMDPVMAGDWSPLNLGNQTAVFCQQLEAAMQQPYSPYTRMLCDDVHRFAKSLATGLTESQKYVSPWPPFPAGFTTLSDLSGSHLLMQEGKLGLVLLRLVPPPPSASFTPNSAEISLLRSIAAEVQQRHAHVEIGLTGLPVMEDDEMASGNSSMFRASFVSLIGVACLFLAGFGGARHALLACVTLLMALAWAFGYVTLAVGHLNIMSVAFAVALIGIGIDYAVHYMARYMQYRDQRLGCEASLTRTARRVGPAVAVGALTTAISFFAAGMTTFVGVAELGIIAGGGILLTMIAALVVLPALTAIVDRSPLGRKRPVPMPVHRAILPLLNRPGLVLAAGGALTVVAALGLPKVYYDYNLLNLQPDGLQSVELERKLLKKCNQSLWYALSIADTREELLARKEQFMQLPTVERTEEIVSLLPFDWEVKRPMVLRVHNRLQGLPERPPLLEIDRPERLGEVLGRCEQLIAQLDPNRPTARYINDIRGQLRQLPLAECYAALAGIQQQMAGDLLNRMHTLSQMSYPEPPELSDLPESLVKRFVGQHGRYLLRIYGRGSIWDMDALEDFVQDVQSVDARATGNPLQAFHSAQELMGSFQWAAIYALVVIVTVLAFDFRSVKFTLLAMLPLCVGVAQTFGLLGIFQIPLNPANLIALPLLLGIGIDYGVHVLHEYREQQGPYRLSPSLALALVVDAMTTIVGFGSLMVASHQGLHSLGRVLTIGISCSLITSVILLPALLMLISRNRVAHVDEQPAESEVPQVSPGKRLSDELFAKIAAEGSDKPPRPLPLPREPRVPAPAENPPEIGVVSDDNPAAPTDSFSHPPGETDNDLLPGELDRPEHHPHRRKNRDAA